MNRSIPQRARAVLVPLAAGATLLLSACGFHLQGHASLPAVLAAAHVEAVDPQSDFYLGLRDALRASGTTLLETRVANAAEIRILADGSTEHVLAVSSSNIPTAYQIDYTVRVAVFMDGRELMAPEAHTLSREYSFNQAALLAKERERETLSTALADDLVTLVMRRLASLALPP